MRIPRLGIRKLVTKAFESRFGQVADKQINKVVTAPGMIARKIDSNGTIKKSVDKMKANPIKVSSKHSNMNLRLKDHEQTNKLNTQEVKDQKEFEAFEAEKSDGVKFMQENGVDPANVDMSLLEKFEATEGDLTIDTQTHQVVERETAK